jgi:Domain of unknown function (DUF1788)
MLMLSLKERIELLESDLAATPMRISVYRDLPFAILRYDPQDEWRLRREAGLLATRLSDVGKKVRIISLAALLWKAIDTTEGIDAVAMTERERGFEAAQRQVTTYLSDPVWEPLPDLLANEMKGLDPQRHVVFLTRAAAMAPAIYHMSALLDAMQGRTDVPTILFYPGTQEGPTGLRFMGLTDREALSNYRVKIYG